MTIGNRLENFVKRVMSRMWCVPLFTILLVPILVFGQDVGSERLRISLKNTPGLTFDAVDIGAHSPINFVGISSIAADDRGNLYVIHRPESGDPIVELDRNGHFIRSWGKGMFKIPHSIRIDAAGYVWAMDANTSIICKFTPKGKKLLEISVGGIPDSTQEFCGATDIAFSEKGHLFVTDGYCNARILEYDSAGRKLNEWGSSGSGPGEFKLIHSIAIGPNGNIYVADRENGRIQWFDQHGGI